MYISVQFALILRTMGASARVARSGYSWGGSKLFRCWPVKQNPGLILGSGSQAGLTEYKSAAQRLRLDLQSLEVRGPSETKTATYKTLLYRYGFRRFGPQSDYQLFST